jgi:hypothetical protein
MRRDFIDRRSVPLLVTVGGSQSSVRFSESDHRLPDRRRWLLKSMALSDCRTPLPRAPSRSPIVKTTFVNEHES